MKSKFNTSTRLYEQADAEPNTPAVDTNIPAESTNTPVDNQNTGKLHAFAITADNINGVNKILTGDSKEWKSEVPLTVMGKDGTIGGPAILNGKPIYLMIRVASKTERASSESQLELSDRIYVLLDTTIKELSSWLKEANNKDERIRVSAKLPSGKEHSVELWQESGVSPESVNTAIPDDPSSVDNNVSQVSVDMDAQIQNPGTAAGVTGTVSENRIFERIYYGGSSSKVYKDLKNNPTARTIANVLQDADMANDNEAWVEAAFAAIKDKAQYDEVSKALGKDARSFVLRYMDKGELSKKYHTGPTIAAKYSQLMNEPAAEAVAKKVADAGVGTKSTNTKGKNKGYTVSKGPDGVGHPATRYLVKDGGDKVWAIKNMETYNAIKKMIGFEGDALLASEAIAIPGDPKKIFAKDKLTGIIDKNTYLAALGKSKKTSGPFKNKEEGDAFRTWANSTPELAAKYGKTSKFDLDKPSAKSRWNNSFIKKAYAAAKDEYAKHKEDGQEDERTKNFKYKDMEGKTVYYKLDDKPKSSDDDIDLDSLASNTKSEDKVSTKKTKTHTKSYDGRQEAKYEGIATNFDTWKSITEDDANNLASDDIDSEADLIKDIEAGRIKKGKIIKQIDSDTLEIESNGKNIKLKISNIIDSEKLKSAAASKKAKEAEETEKKAEEEKAAEIEADKSDVEGAKDDLTDAKDTKKDAKKKLKDTKKTKRKKKRTAKVNKRIAEIEKKTKDVNTSESVVYNFDDFMNKVNTLNG